MDRGGCRGDACRAATRDEVPLVGVVAKRLPVLDTTVVPAMAQICSNNCPRVHHLPPATKHLC